MVTDAMENYYVDIRGNDVPDQVDGFHYLLNSNITHSLHGLSFKSWFFSVDSWGDEIIRWRDFKMLWLRKKKGRGK